MRRLLRQLDSIRHSVRVRTMTAGHANGKRAEDLAFRLLQDRGYIVVARNFRTRAGSAEIDLIAWNGHVLTFVEVKSLESDAFGSPDRAVDDEKRRHITRGAREYLHRHELEETAVRFDIVTVVFGPPLQLVLIQDAFGWQTPDSRQRRQEAYASR